MSAGVHRLRDLPLPARLLATGFVLSLATGYAAAHANLRLTHGELDGEPGLSRADVVAAYHGRPDRTLLTSKIDGGSMGQYIPRPSDRAVILDWVQAGATDATFPETAAVLDRLCVRCHHPGGEMPHATFADSRAEGSRFDLLVPYTAPDTGISWPALARTTHVHLFGMGMLFTMAGAVFLMSDVSQRAKTVVIAAPFAAMFVDIGCWWLTKLDPLFAVGVMAGGLLMALSFAVMVARPLFELWTPRLAAVDG